MPDRRLPDGKRDRIVELFNTTKLSNKEIATEVGASERTVYTYRKRYRSTGVAVNPRTGRAPNSGNYKLFPLHDEALLALSEIKGDLYLDELRDFLLDKFALNISVSALSKWIQRVEWSSKKSSRIASKRIESLRSSYTSTIRSYSPQMLVFIEESGIDRSLGGTTTWAPLGSPVLRRSFVTDKGSFVIFPALGAKGFVDCAVLPTTPSSTSSIESGEAVETTERATPAQPHSTFMFWVKNFVLPKMNPFPAERSVMVVDADPPEELTSLCEEAGVKLVARPPYSPDLNPIELFFIDLDRRLRKHEPPDAEGLDVGMLSLLVRQDVEKLSAQQDQILSYFKRVGVGKEGMGVLPEGSRSEGHVASMFNGGTFSRS